MNIEDALSRIRPEMIGCPTDLMVQVLRDVIRDFCSFTRAWIFEVDFETIAAGLSEYDIELPGTHAYPIAIEYMSLDGAPVVFKDVGWLDQNIANWRTREADDFRYFTQIQPKTFLFPCVPTMNGTSGGLYYRVSLKPVEDATVIDDLMHDEFIETWACGAKGRLQEMAAKPWSDPKRALENRRYYLAERGQARIRANTSFGNAEQRWSNPGGFA